MKLKTGDNVKVMRGKSRGKSGKIMQVFPALGKDKVVVEGVNMFKKHLRQKKEGVKGQIIEFAAPLYASNVMLICSTCGQPTRFGSRLEADKKARYCKKCKATT